MVKLFLMIFIFGALGCSSREVFYYGDLPCANMLTEYKNTILNIKESLIALNDVGAKKLITDEAVNILRFNDEIFHCVFLVHQHDEENYSKMDRDLIMLFSASSGTVQSANKVFLKNISKSTVALKVLKNIYFHETEWLNRTSQKISVGFQ